MHVFLENLLIMVLTIVVLLGGAYVLLLVLGWWLRVKSGGREQQGLTDLWIASQTDKTQNSTQDQTSDKGP